MSDTITPTIVTPTMIGTGACRDEVWPVEEGVDAENEVDAEDEADAEDEVVDVATDGSTFIKRYSPVSAEFHTLQMPCNESPAHFSIYSPVSHTSMLML